MPTNVNPRFRRNGGRRPHECPPIENPLGRRRRLDNSRKRDRQRQRAYGLAHPKPEPAKSYSPLAVSRFKIGELLRLFPWGPRSQQ